MFSLSLVLGTAIGPFFGLLLSSHYSIDVLFGLCLVFGIVSLILSFFININFETTPLTKTEGKKDSVSVNLLLWMRFPLRLLF